MISSFEFVSYKIDTFTLKTQPSLLVLIGMDTIKPEDWEFRVSFRLPQHFKEHGIYIGGLDIELRVTKTNDDNEQEEHEIHSAEDNNTLVSVKAGISGAFKILEGAFLPKQEQSLVKNQIPSLLMPLLRSSIMSFLANAGFGSVIIPLINIHEMAKKTLSDIEVAVID